VNRFVEECRNEWKRLGVSDPVANEMAADLAADLEEAEAEGASAEDVLGSGAFDPRSFATAWAAERGVIQRPPPNEHELPSRSRMAAAIGVFALIAIIGAVLVIVASPSTPERLALASPVGARLLGDRAHALLRLPAPPPGTMRVEGIWVDPNGSRRVVTLPLPAPPASRIVAVDVNDSGVDTRTVGSVLLTMGLAGVVLLTLFWLWVGPGPWLRRRAPIAGRPSGPAY
jgi:hypothetical protein